MKVRLFLVLALTTLFALSAFAGGTGTGKSKKAVKDKSACTMDKASTTSADHCKDGDAAACKMSKASSKMDCCKDGKGSKASNTTKSSKKATVVLAKDAK